MRFLLLPLTGFAAAALLTSSRAPVFAQSGACAQIAATTKIEVVGVYSNMRYTEEHAYGYDVMLWRAGTCVIGFFESSAGLQGDTPIGELQNLKYDAASGKLSFSAKLTMGVVSFKGSNGWEPSRDLFSFDGALKTDSLTGVVTSLLQNNPNAEATRTDVVLKLKKTSDLEYGSATYGAWQERWQPILKARGPKW